MRAPIAEREAQHDPRLSIEERYGTRARYEVLVTDAANNLVAEKYLLSEDVPQVVARALAALDEITKGTALAGK